MQNDASFPDIDMSETPADYDGPIKGSALIPWIGPAKGVIVGGELSRGSKAPNHPSIQWRVRLLEQGHETDEIQGKKPYAGVDKNGKTLVRNIDDLMFSVGYTKEQIHQMRTNGQKFNPRQFIKDMTGQTIYFFLGSSSDEETGKEYSNLDNFMSKADYEDAIKTPGMGRRERPKASAVTAPVGGPGKPTGLQAPAPSALGGPGAVPPPVPAPLPFTAPNGAVPAPANAGQLPPPPPLAR
jgi:hypothetical protein